MNELQKLLQDDLPRLSTYFLDMKTVQGDGVLLVNYYPNDAIAQMEAKFLKSSVIPKYARQMGLADLVAQFEAHDRQTQMVVAVVTPETKGTIAVEVSSTPAPETPAPSAKSTAKPKARGKTSTRTTATSPAPEPEAKPEPSTKSTAKPKARGKTSARTTATSPVPEPEAKPDPSPPSEKPAKPATRHKARRNPARTTARRRKAT